MDEAGSSGSTQKLSRISPSLAATSLYKSHFGGRFIGPGRRHSSAEHEPVHVWRELEVEMVLVGRIVVGRQDAVENVRLGRRAYQIVQFARFRAVRTRWACGGHA